MTNPLVSIIVPCYNQAQYLPETLDSVLAQSYPNWECIIVNDGSPDNTDEIAKVYCDKDKRFKYVYQVNGGVSSARNNGIKKSSGEYILPLDSDDKIGIQYIEKAIEQFKLFPETKLVYCKAQLFGEEVGEWLLPQYDYVHLLFENIVFCSGVFKRDDYDNTFGYNEKMEDGFEDWDFWLSLLKDSDIVYIIPEIWFFYRIRKKSRNNSISIKTEESLKIQIYNNHKAKYLEHIPYLIWMNPKIDDQNKYISALNFEIKRIQSSKAYRLGKFILKPFSFIRNKILSI